MTKSHNRVANALCNGEDKEVKGNSMTYKPETDNNPACIVGYGWATYAVKRGNNIIVFWDWNGYSHSTSTHLTRIERAARYHDMNVVYMTDVISVGGLGRGAKGPICNTRPTDDQIDDILPDDPSRLGEYTDRYTVQEDGERVRA